MVTSHGLPLALLVGLLPLSYLISSFVSVDPSISFTGYGVEVDTVLFAAIAFLVFLFSFTYFRTLRTVRLLSSVLMWAFVGVVAFQWIVVLFGTSLVPFQVFSDRSLNLIGKWNDLGLIAGLLAIIFLVRLEIARPSLLWRGVGVAGLIAIAILLGIVNFPLTWWLIMLASVVIGLTAYLTQRGEERLERESNPYVYSSLISKIPWYALGGVIVSVLFLLFGAQINSNLTGRLPISSLEVRPSYSSTFGVINAARNGSFEKILFGTGPNTFTTSWLGNKPPEVNQSQFWNLDFSVGFSTLVTALGTVGLLGAIAWLIPAFLVLAAIVRAVRLSLLNREERVAGLIVSLGSLYLITALALYVPSANVTLLAFILAGAAFGFLWRQGRHVTEENPQQPVGPLMAWGVIAVAVILCVVSAWATDRRFIAEAKTNGGAASLQAGNADDALKAAESAQGVEQTENSMRLAVESGLLKIQQLASSKDAATPAIQKQFLDTASTTISSASTLIKKYPNDYRSYISLARIYDLLSSLKVQGAYQNAEAAYQAALARNPSAPDIALALARLEAANGKVDLTQKFLSQALTLKPNYTDAILLVVQLSVAANDLQTAVRAATAAAQTAPGIAPIWFQLGLLYYAGNDTKDAIPPLEQAIKIVPDYANAKYFLGLSYYAQGKSADALKEFSDLAKSNPDSNEVKLILSNMQMGKQPFESAQPPITNKPAARETAPIPQ
jgi:tetratricopeptide (TPR) repeat protein